jgi:hypothetical protein
VNYIAIYQLPIQQCSEVISQIATTSIGVKP